MGGANRRREGTGETLSAARRKVKKRKRKGQTVLTPCLFFLRLDVVDHGHSDCVSCTMVITPVASADRVTGASDSRWYASFT